MKVIKGDFKVEWSWIGEGYNGDYNPHNPIDDALLRFYCFKKDKYGWEEIDCTSYCTRVVRGTSMKILRELTVPILDALTEEMGQSFIATRKLQRRLQKLSWMEAPQ